MRQLAAPFVALLCAYALGTTSASSATEDEANGAAASWGAFSFQISTAPVAVGPITVDVQRPRRRGDGNRRRLEVDLVFENGHGSTATFTDHYRSSAFASGGAGDQLLVADRGCGWAVLDQGGPVSPGFCNAYLDGLSLKPGASGVRTLSVWRGLKGMTPLNAGHYEFVRPVKFHFEGDRAAVRSDLVVSLDVVDREN